MQLRVERSGFLASFSIRVELTVVSCFVLRPPGYGLGLRITKCRSRLGRRSIQLDSFKKRNSSLRGLILRVRQELNEACGPQPAESKIDWGGLLPIEAVAIVCRLEQGLLRTRFSCEFKQLTDEPDVCVHRPDDEIRLSGIQPSCARSGGDSVALAVFEQAVSSQRGEVVVSHIEIQPKRRRLSLPERFCFESLVTASLEYPRKALKVLLVTAS